MIQGIDIIKKLVDEEDLVKNLCERELKNPEYSGYDLRLGEVHELVGEAFLGIDERKTPETKVVASFDENGESKKIVMEPGDYFLGKTVEKVKIPEDLLAVYFIRSMFWRSGIKLISGMIGPGYNGNIIFPMCNAGPTKVNIELGARAIHIFFIKVEGETSAYKGQWQGGRVAAVEIEKQV